jgi:lipoprotein-anchoring transpeptidase ErfK/SrfK
MKAKIATMMVVLVTIALFVGCAGVQKAKDLAAEKPQAYELGGLFLTKDEKQMTGIAKDSAKLGVGETIVIYARGQSTVETGGKVFELPADVVVEWKADNELEVTPNVGHIVTVKLVKPIEVAAYVTATTTTKTGQKIEAGFTITKK